MGDEFWLISAPGEKTCQQTWEKLNKMLPSNTLTENFKFHIPDLKVGTLDLLVGLSDDLAKLDTYVDGVTRKIAQYLGDVVEGQKDKLYENLLANGVDLNTYATHFQWDTAKFPIKQSLVLLTEIISKKVSQIDNEFKVRSSNYNSLKKELDNMERKNIGSLLTRNLNDIVHKDQFVVGSEYLITLLVVVPKHIYKEWDQTYEKLTDMVVPQSSKLIYEDEENGLYTVTVFKKVVDEFKQHAREKKFMVRDFTYDEGQLATDKTEVTKLTADAKKAYAPLVRWLQVNFNEAFTSWIHVKALRVFVESVLRYGLPVNFIAILLHPLKKNHKKVREILFQMFKHLDSTSAGPHAADNEDIPGLNYGQADYYPYVYFAISTNYVDVKK